MFLPDDSRFDLVAIFNSSIVASNRSQRVRLGRDTCRDDAADGGEPDHARTG
jgi:hypothetical protein